MEIALLVGIGLIVGIMWGIYSVLYDLQQDLHKLTPEYKEWYDARSKK